MRTNKGPPNGVPAVWGPGQDSEATGNSASEDLIPAGDDDMGPLACQGRSYHWPALEFGKRYFEAIRTSYALASPSKTFGADDLESHRAKTRQDSADFGRGGGGRDR